jgi:cytosine deaminase
LSDYGIAPGKKADLVVLGAPSVRAALRLQPPRRHVIKDGVEVARTTVTQEILPTQK